MRTTAELNLLEQIYTEMQELKRRMENNQERRIGRQEFAHMLNDTKLRTLMHTANKNPH